MDNPGQHLIHVTNRGPSVFGSMSLGEFKVSMKQPIKDINKFGMLHYAVPKMVDHVVNEKFTVRLHNDNQSEVIDIIVELPAGDYNNCYEGHLSTHGFGRDTPIFVRPKAQLCFDEILQCKINWAIMREYGRRIARPNPTAFEMLLGRIGCVVERPEETGCYSISFGYKGEQNIRANVNGADGNAVDYIMYTGPLQPNTGSPFQPYRVITPQGLAVGGPIGAQNKPNPMPNRAGNIRLLDPYNDIIAVNVNDDQIFKDVALLGGVEILDLSMRLQLMMGFLTADTPEATKAQQRKTVGRMQLRNYPHPLFVFNTGVWTITAPLQPNLSPPSMMYLQLTVPGTRSKILGQSDERGGWAIPTPSNQFVSTYLNYPLGPHPYHRRMVRKKPVVRSNLTFNFHMRQRGLGANRNGNGYNMDPFPVGYSANAVGVVTRMWPKPFAQANAPPVYGWAGGAAMPAALLADSVVANTNDVPNMRNWNVDNNAMPYSPLIGFGEETSNKKPMKRLSGYYGGTTNSMTGVNSGFGCSKTRNNPFFTVSLIEPNFIFTTTENTTMQTFDMRLMWGDTSETVDGLSGYPCQFSIIASP